MNGGFVVVIVANIWVDWQNQSHFIYDANEKSGDFAICYDTIPGLALGYGT